KLTPELSRTALRPRRWHSLRRHAEAAKRYRLERIVRQRLAEVSHCHKPGKAKTLAYRCFLRETRPTGSAQPLSGCAVLVAEALKGLRLQANPGLVMPNKRDLCPTLPNA